MNIPDDPNAAFYVVTDTETTGLQPPEAELTEIGAIKLSGRKEVEDFSRFQSLIKPTKLIPPHITRITGINNTMVKDADDSTTVFGRYLSFLGDAVFVAHNTSFDLKFLRAEAVKADIEFPDVPTLCTMKLAKAVFVTAKYSLGSLCKEFDIEIKDRHRAMGDVEGTVELLWILLDKAKEQGLSTLPEILRVAGKGS